MQWHVDLGIWFRPITSYNEMDTYFCSVDIPSLVSVSIDTLLCIYVYTHTLYNIHIYIYMCICLYKSIYINKYIFIKTYTSGWVFAFYILAYGINKNNLGIFFCLRL